MIASCCKYRNKAKDSAYFHDHFQCNNTNSIDDWCDIWHFTNTSHEDFPIFELTTVACWALHDQDSHCLL